MSLDASEKEFTLDIDKEQLNNMLSCETNEEIAKHLFLSAVIESDFQFKKIMLKHKMMEAVKKQCVDKM